MPSNEVAIQVVNHHWSDLVIHFQPQGRSERLGLARTSATSNFFLPFRRLEPTGQFRLRADEVGGDRAIVSELIVVQPGQTVEWAIENRLTRSSVVVW